MDDSNDSLDSVWPQGQNQIHFAAPLRPQDMFCMTFLPSDYRQQVHDHLSTLYSRIRSSANGDPSAVNTILTVSDAVKRELRIWQALQLAKVLHDATTPTKMWMRMLTEYWRSWEVQGQESLNNALTVLKQEKDDNTQASQRAEKRDSDSLVEVFENLKIQEESRLTQSPAIDTMAAVEFLEREIGSLTLSSGSEMGPASDEGGR